MEINSANLSANSNAGDWNASNAKSAAAPVADNSKVVAAPEDKVSISPEAINAQKQEQAADAGAAKAAAPAAAAPKSADQAAPPKAAGAAGADAKEKQPAAKSFVYGALGLERPEKTEDKPTDGYTMGRWIAAGITAGAIISILV